MGMIADFKKFALKGNVFDLAVAVVIGGAFGKIVAALVADIIMPLVALVMPSGDWRSAGIVLRAGATAKDDVVLKWGDFMGTILDFLIVGFALFLLVSKVLTTLKLREEAVAPDMKECAFCLESIPKKAKKCKACTADVVEAAA